MHGGQLTENRITLKAKPLMEKQIMHMPNQREENRSRIMPEQLVEKQIIDQRNLSMSVSLGVISTDGIKHCRWESQARLVPPSLFTTILVGTQIVTRG
ncbi:Uncharacterized protein TCM_013380 [Theobroma cacao]|uniref:Uncharacterized protein n=1 Tax=Theobroma cacao TaxID=3641 RepID=A0A061FXG0_THECC|nr:Uncharacterized protein TCM_013380 [Theobroma cacao]